MFNVSGRACSGITKPEQALPFLILKADLLSLFHAHGLHYPGRPKISVLIGFIFAQYYLGYLFVIRTLAFAAQQFNFASAQALNFS